MYSSSSPDKDGSSSDISKRLNIDFIESVPPKPELSSKICLQDSKSLQAFLTLSRRATDDNLRPVLNSILNHNEESENSIFKFKRTKNSSESPCLELLNQLIYPEWKKRSEVIKYCQHEIDEVITNAEIMDDDLAKFSKLSPDEKNNLLRVDPYTYKNLKKKLMEKNSKNLELQSFYQNELKIETIVQQRSTELMNDLCKLGHFNISDNFFDYVSKTIK